RDGLPPPGLARDLRSPLDDARPRARDTRAPVTCFGVRPPPAAFERPLTTGTMPPARRGGRAVECGGLENRYPSFGGSRVQIPPPPLYQAETPHRWAASRPCRHHAELCS